MVFQTVSPRDKIGEILCEFGDNERIYVIDSDLAKSTTSAKFGQMYPNRFVECGISEQSAVSIATGLAIENKIPFYVNFAILATGTAWTQLRQACYSNANIKIIATHPGMDDGPDGASHHANEDLALTRSIPNLKVLVPSSIEELKEAIALAIDYEGPVYIRAARDVVPVLDIKHNKVEFGKSDMIIDDGNDLALIYEGTAALCAMEAYEELKNQDYKCKVINISSIKPIDTEMIDMLVNSVKGIVTIENHSIIGGLGGAVSEVLATYSKHPKLRRIGVEDVFTESGKISDVKKKYGLNTENVINKCKETLA
ncbi:transketolase family protein [Clostridium neonatale]|uniref:transketolase family protein n=1 Tax=Clostridium neonatale TaxID=137838 RepID=UPI003D34D777